MAKRQYAAVYLIDEVDRLGGYQGKAYANTSYFRAKDDKGQDQYSIELDSVFNTVLVRHVSSGASIEVPRERVKRFEPFPPPPAEGK